jgi:hypothetical protein
MNKVIVINAGLEVDQPPPSLDAGAEESTTLFY